MVLRSTISPRHIPSTTKYIMEREKNNLFVLLFLYTSKKKAGSSLEMFSSRILKPTHLSYPFHSDLTRSIHHL